MILRDLTYIVGLAVSPDRVAARVRSALPSNPVQPVAIWGDEARPTTRYRPEDDPSYCCEECEALAALIGARRRGDATAQELDEAAAAHGCRRSPIGAGR